VKRNKGSSFMLKEKCHLRWCLVVLVVVAGVEPGIAWYYLNTP
jgi:hypothetical protein